jgi:hypothetical protein
MPRWLTLGAVSLSTTLIGCVPLTSHPGQASSHKCAVGTAWSTAYAATHPLGALAADQIRVLRYRVTVHPDHGTPCGSLVLAKHLTILRGPGPLRIVEVRNFYRRGHLVANHRAFISRQIPSSGTYTAQLTLPIPASAPFGHYHVVSLLYARWGAGSAHLIAKARTRFSVGP